METVKRKKYMHTYQSTEENIFIGTKLHQRCSMIFLIIWYQEQLSETFGSFNILCKIYPGNMVNHKRIVKYLEIKNIDEIK